MTEVTDATHVPFFHFYARQLTYNFSVQDTAAPTHADPRPGVRGGELFGELGQQN